MGHLERIEVVWGVEKFRCSQNGKKVYLYYDHQAIESSFKSNQMRRQYCRKLKKWFHSLCRSNISRKHTAGSETYRKLHLYTGRQNYSRRKIQGGIRDQ